LNDIPIVAASENSINDEMGNILSKIDQLQNLQAKIQTYCTKKQQIADQIRKGDLSEVNILNGAFHYISFLIKWNRF